MYENVIEFGLTASEWLQATYPQLAEPMQIISDLGTIPVYLLLITLIYWCFDKHIGGQLTYILLVSAFFNTAFKQVLRQPRPFWLDSTLAEDGSSGYGFPSGHVQTATVLTYFFAGRFRENWLWVLATVYTAVMALSRVYLGMHFVHDVIGGFLLGGLILVAFLVLENVFGTYFSRRLFGQRLLVVALIPLVLVAVWALAVLWLGEPDVPTLWRDRADSAEIALTAGVIQSVSMLFGFGTGLMLERSRVRFQAGGALWQRPLRFIVGSIGTGLIFVGLTTAYETIVPEGALWLALPLWAVQFTLLGLWVSYYAPRLFVALRLASYSAEPELPYTIRGSTMPISRK